MKLGIVVFFKVLIQNFKGAAILGHVIDDVSSWYKWNFLLTKQVILYTVGKQILRWLTFSEEPYPENQFTVELCVMTMKNDTKIDEELTCRFKIDLKNFTNFEPSAGKSKKFVLIGSLWPKYILFELQKYRGVIFHDTEELCKFWRKTDQWFEKRHEKFGKFSPEHLKVSKLELWWDPIVQSRKCMSLKFTEKLCNDNEEWYKSWRGTDLSF